MHPPRSHPAVAGVLSARLKRSAQLLLTLLVIATASPAIGQTSGSTRPSSSPIADSPGAANVSASDAANAIQLQQPAAGASTLSRDQRPSRGINSNRPELRAPDAFPPNPSEFEEYVNRLAFPNSVARPDTPLAIRRLGSGLITGQNRDGESIDYNPQVPPEYLIATGDEIVLSVWGSVDAELRLIVDRSGRISVPRVGTIMVSGVRYGDLPSTISQRVAQTFKNFQLSVSLGQLRGVRVFVTGFAVRPGAYTVSALSTVANAVVRAGGPSASGSFRNIQLRRGNTVVATLDFYDLLLNGDRSADRLVQADDVVHVGPIGLQVGVIGSVNRPAVFELKPGETMADALRMAGGFAAVADTSRLALERVDERTTLRVTQLDVPQAGAVELRNGDVLRAFSVVTLATPQLRQNKRVRIEGEVMRPGDYVMPAMSSIDDAIRAAGGLTPGAFVFGTEFTRESVRQTQQENYERVLRNLETELALSNSTQRITSRDEAAAQAGRGAAAVQLIDRLRNIRPTGRIVLQIPPDTRDLPNLTLEDGDRLFVPSMPTSVGVFGSVFNAGSYLREDGRTLADYLRQAGGPRRGADAGSTFVLRANGTVISNLQERGWSFGLSGNFEQLPALPGDTLFVPEELDKTTFVQYAKDWTQILAQFALGVAAFVTLTD
jgi:protein involved in polysaccharide export with SLBB domain